jgi:hypothetical protein
MRLVYEGNLWCEVWFAEATTPKPFGLINPVVDSGVKYVVPNFISHHRILPSCYHS